MDRVAWFDPDTAKAHRNEPCHVVLVRRTRWGDGAETVAKRCGFDPQKSERRSYLRLYEDYLKSHPDAPPEMTFTDR